MTSPTIAEHCSCTGGDCEQALPDNDIILSETGERSFPVDENGGRCVGATSAPTAPEGGDRRPLEERAEHGGRATGSDRQQHSCSFYQRAQTVQCQCDRPAKEERVKKYGPTQGQLFWTCALPLGTPGRCNFFRWVDEAEGKRLSFKGRRFRPVRRRFQPYWLA
jgi:hypothetical protein